MLILGIDAAWTPHTASGIALLESGKARRVRYARTQVGAFESLLDPAPDVIAVDMPLANEVIEKRRHADNEVSRYFGRYKASVHSPTRERPGSHGRDVTRIFTDRGYELATTADRRPPQALIEVFPLAALVRLMGVNERPKYKAAKRSTYWPDASRTARMQNLREEWRRIEACLADHIALRDPLVPAEFLDLTIGELKRYEDTIDGIICALVGALYAEGRAEPFGDAESAIWVPRP